jgi:transglutaminase-like putative cysteine protease
VLFAAIAVAAASYHSLLADFSWWVFAVGATGIIFGALAVARRLWRADWIGSLVGIAVAIFVLVLFFAPTTAILGIIPTFDTFEALGELANAGSESIATQGIPATPTPGIVFLLTAGFAVIALLLDVLTFTVRRPALTGIPLLLLIAVPSLIDTTIREPIFFVLVAVAYFALILSLGSRRQRSVAIAISASAIVGSLVLSVLLPPVLSDENVNIRANGYTTGLNPFINLGQDLRRSDPITAIDYTTTSDKDEYFTLTVLKDFTGDAWEPVDRSGGESDMSAIGPAPGRADDATRALVETDVTVGNVQGRWLPVPFAASSIDGLDGSWQWNPETLAIWTTDSNMRGQTYTVQTDAGRPSAQELYSAGTTVPDGLDDYLELPDDLAPIVATTAQEVVGDVSSNYEKAIALQSYFRSGKFTYSTDAPVEQGYDGSSAAVIEKFLEVKSGYCVHFASAFATMARTLGIPARIGVGFTAGAASLDIANRVTRHTVTTDDLHAWPELYFDQIGWVRFEPTVSRGTVPNYGTLQADDPKTPEIETSQTPSATPTPTSSAGAATPRPEQTSSAVDPDTTVHPIARATLTTIAIAIGVVLLLLLPLFWRTARRSRRFNRVRATGSALDAWSEIRDTAIDLGLSASESDTPRAFATELATRMRPSGIDPLWRLLGGVEALAFSQEPRKVGAADLRTVLVALRGQAALRERLRARFAPASVLSSFRRSPVETE